MVAGIGTPHLPEAALMALVFMSGYAVLGTQLGLSASAGMIYPTAVRANGVGWAHGVGRLGAIAGPTVAAQLLARHLPLQQLLYVPAIPLFCGLLAALGVARLYRRPGASGGGKQDDAFTPAADAGLPAR